MNCNNTEAVTYLQEGDIATCIMILRQEIAKISTATAPSTDDAVMPMIPQHHQHQQQQMEEEQARNTPTSSTSYSESFLKDEETKMMMVEDDDEDTASCYDDEELQEEEVLHSVLVKEGEIFGADVDEKNLLSFYPCAFVLPEDDEDHVSVDDADDDKPNVRKPVVLMYNLALAFHLSAAAPAGSSSSTSPSSHQVQLQHRALQSACWLYRRAMDIVMMSWNENDIDDMRCLVMAIINNMGYICSQTMDFHGARRCIRLLCEMVQAEANTGHEDRVVPIEDYNIFFHSVVTYLHGGINGELALAPAA